MSNTDMHSPHLHLLARSFKTRGPRRAVGRWRARGDLVRAGEAGAALIVVILLMPILMALGAALTTVITMDMRLRGAFQRTTTGFYAAESGVNRGMGEYRNIFQDYRVPTSADLAPRSFTVGSRDVSYQLAEVPGNPSVVTIPMGEVFGGLNSIQYTYTVTSDAVSNDETEASIGAEFDVSYVPLFQFAAFYANDLESLPGPIKHLHGRVHTNGDLYLNAGDQLFIEDNPANGITTVQVSAKGDVYRGRKDKSECTGTVVVDMLQDLTPPTPDLDPRNLDCNGSGTRKVPSTELAAWKGSVISGIQTVSVPEPDVTARGGGAFWAHADLRIALKLNQADQLPGGVVLPHAIEVQDAAGNRDATLTALLHQFMTDAAYNVNFSSLPNTLPLFYTDVPGGCANTAAACYTPAFATDARVYAGNNFDLDYRRGGFYNQREKKWLYLLNINVHDLLDWNQRQPAGARFFDPADSTDGGVVVYTTVDGPSSGVINNYGVRVFGSAQLPFPPSADPTGLTLVTHQAAYILGSYNSVGKQPAAVIADSVNVMSGNYFNNPAVLCTNDCQSNLPLGDATRTAGATTVNTAFLGGVDTTTPGNYNGGLENYLRFHENWTGVPLNYLGSFVSLATPHHVNGVWCGTGSGCNIYNPPDRNFDYDPDFNDVRNLPPLTPRFLYLQQVLFTQDFR